MTDDQHRLTLLELVHAIQEVERKCGWRPQAIYLHASHWEQLRPVFEDMCTESAAQTPPEGAVAEFEGVAIFVTEES